MTLEGLEPTIPASKPPQTYALDGVATLISKTVYPRDKT
jgi:hypothetical protein